PRPGPVGRLARLILGVMCIWYVYGLIMIGADIISPAGNVRPIVWNGIVPALFIISYVVNIGYSRAWKKWPAIASAVVIGGVAVVGYLMTGNAETMLLARTIWAWELYIFGHLGISFVIAAVIGTPGCEMRAIHDLYSRITGTPTKEHYCPVGPLNPIDQWEAQRSR
ncbi:MAG: hypothetical protein KJP16_08890, partial [Gammaproteobacteria bacterium]|nr:hypothetical protein [Gammaproteobacteria bacterium]